MNEFSSLKAAWHVDRIVDMRAGRDAIPTHLQIVLSDLCNQNCHFCAYRMEGGFSTANFADADGNRNPVRFIPTAKAKEILDDCAALGIGAVEFTGGGEPTVHPDCFEIIGYAQGLGLKTGLVTNGVRMKDCAALRGLTWLRISLDAGKSETYQRIRDSKAWDKVMRNITLAGTLEGPYVGVGFVITRENYSELIEACQIVKAAGIPYMRVSAMFSDGGADYYAGLEDEVVRAREQAAALQSDTFKVVDFFGNRISDLKQQAPDYSFCGYQQFVLYVGGDQKVYTCCTNAYTPHGEIGDLKVQSLKDWLGSTKRRDFDARGCHHCQFNDKNRVINYLLEDAPKHVDFV